MGVRIADGFTGDTQAEQATLNLDLDHFRARILQDALTEATATYWERRAQVFETAAPRAGDYHGHATPDELVAQAIRCSEAARNCRFHAQLIREQA